MGRPNWRARADTTRPARAYHQARREERRAAVQQATTTEPPAAPVAWQTIVEWPKMTTAPPTTTHKTAAAACAFLASIVAAGVLHGWILIGATAALSAAGTYGVWRVRNRVLDDDSRPLPPIAPARPKPRRNPRPVDH